MYAIYLQATFLNDIAKQPTLLHIRMYVHILCIPYVCTAKSHWNRAGAGAGAGAGHDLGGSKVVSRRYLLAYLLTCLGGTCFNCLLSLIVCFFACLLCFFAGRRGEERRGEVGTYVYLRYLPTKLR